MNLTGAAGGFFTCSRETPAIHLKSVCVPQVLAPTRFSVPPNLAVHNDTRSLRSSVGQQPPVSETNTAASAANWELSHKDQRPLAALARALPLMLNTIG